MAGQKCTGCGQYQADNAAICRLCATVYAGETAAPMASAPGPAPAPDHPSEPDWVALTKVPEAASSVGPGNARPPDPLPVHASPAKSATRWRTVAVVAGVLVLTSGAAAALAWWAFGDMRTAVELAAATDDPVVAPPPDWQARYTDNFLSDADVTMITRAAARRRDFPAADGTSVAQTYGAGDALTGRWVRGHDGTSRWLRLPGGGYVWDGNLFEPGGAGSPIAISLSNADFAYGSDIDRYLNQATQMADAAAARERAAGKEGSVRYVDSVTMETRSTYVRVPNRRFRGLTVAGVAVHYESTSIYFREPVGAVRAAFVAGGLRIEADGVVPNDDPDLPDQCSITPSPTAEDRNYGATALTCGL